MRKFNWPRIAGIVAQVAFSAPCLACAFPFPTRLLESGDVAVLIQPGAMFSDEIDSILPTPASSRAENDQEELDTASMDVADLAKALGVDRLNAGDRVEAQKTVDRYKAARQALDEYCDARSDWSWKTYYHRKDAGPEPMPGPDLTIPRGIPDEFALYFQGAIFFRSGKEAKARAAWLKLLKLPEEQRRYRSTWAAYMLATSFRLEAPIRSLAWFEQVRSLGRQGFADSLNLAASSLGWEAKFRYDRGELRKAIELYVAQRSACGFADTVSLGFAAARAMDADPATLEDILQCPEALDVLVCYAASHGRFDAPPEQVERLLSKAEKRGNANPSAAERLAVTAYRFGDYAVAKRWLALASQDRPRVRWLKAKLLLRSGQVEEGMRILSDMVKGEAPAEEPLLDGESLAWGDSGDGLGSDGHRRLGELGVLLMARQQYVAALDCLAKGGYWEDAAYVAERVLRTDELKSYVDASWPPKRAEEPDRADDWIRMRLRHLLARRWVRIGRGGDVRPYFPDSCQASWDASGWGAVDLYPRALLDAYVGAIRDGKKTALSRRVRAASFWKAAIIAQYAGMELMGTEVHPDWSLYGGSFERSPLAREGDPERTYAVAQTSEDERQRTLSQSVPTQRFHYRYVALDHAWEAADLLPDDSEDTARILWLAGKWIEKSDPQSADRFYKGLVMRCRKLPLAKEADALKWFPKDEEAEQAFERRCHSFIATTGSKQDEREATDWLPSTKIRTAK